MANKTVWDKGHVEIRTRVPNNFPYLMYQALLARGDLNSQTAYVQEAICEALARDLNLPIEDLRASLPPRRRPRYAPRQPNYMAVAPWGGVDRIGPANTCEEVK